MLTVSGAPVLDKERPCTQYAILGAVLNMAVINLTYRISGLLILPIILVCVQLLFPSIYS
jgi:hypothetical protein